MNSKKAALYIRVSTDAQFEEGYSVDAQQESLIAYCKVKRITNYEVYLDGGFSGSNIDRPAMQSLIKDANDNKLSHCIVYKLDRLSRSQKDTLYIIEDVLNAHNVDFISITESLDTSTPMGKLMIGILSAFAQLERENIRMRTRMGMKERVKQGYWMGGGRVPFGYDYDSKQNILVPNKDADKVREIYRLYIEDYAPQEIANMLGLKYDKLVVQILTRKSNIGIIQYNGEEYQGKHQPIISNEVYEKAMLKMKQRSVMRISTSDNLLTGLMKCGKCGAKMHYQKWGNKSKIVCYSQQKSKKYLIKDPNCSQLKLWTDDVEKIILEYIFKLSVDYRIENNSASDNVLTPLELLFKQKVETEEKIKRLYLLYADGDDLLLDSINKLKAQHKKISNNIDVQIQRNENIKYKNELTDTVKNLENIWDILTVKEKKSILREIIDEIVITDDKISINLKI